MERAFRTLAATSFLPGVRVYAEHIQGAWTDANTLRQAARPASVSKGRVPRGSQCVPAPRKRECPARPRHPAPGQPIGGTDNLRIYAARALVSHHGKIVAIQQNPCPPRQCGSNQHLHMFPPVFQEQGYFLLSTERCCPVTAESRSIRPHRPRVGSKLCTISSPFPSKYFRKWPMWVDLPVPSMLSKTISLLSSPKNSWLGA